MKKEILNEYIDARELIKEIENDISRLQNRKKTVTSEKVKGSMNDFPFTETHFKVEGTPYTYSDDRRLREKENTLKKQKANAEKVKTEVELWMSAIPIRMQRIIRYKFFCGLSWEQTAEKMGRKATGESVKKEFQRFMKEN